MRFAWSIARLVAPALACAGLVLSQPAVSQEVKLNEDKMSALIEIINKHVAPLIQTLTQVPNAEQTFDAAYAAKKLEELLRLENMIDARIAKVLARLVALKEFKRTPAGGAPTKALTSSQAGI